MRLLSVFAMMSCLVAAGCGGVERLTVVAIDGTVQIDGVPLSNATVTYVAEETGKGSLSGAGITDAAGRYQITAGSYNGVPAGKYKVIVTAVMIPGGTSSSPTASDPKTAMFAAKTEGKAVDAIPTHYGDPKQTPLTIEVTSGKTTGYDVKLSRI